MKMMQKHLLIVQTYLTLNKNLLALDPHPEGCVELVVSLELVPMEIVFRWSQCLSGITRSQWWTEVTRCRWWLGGHEEPVAVGSPEEVVGVPRCPWQSGVMRCPWSISTICCCGHQWEGQISTEPICLLRDSDIGPHVPLSESSALTLSELYFNNDVLIGCYLVQEDWESHANKRDQGVYCSTDFARNPPCSESAWSTSRA